MDRNGDSPGHWATIAALNGSERPDGLTARVLRMLGEAAAEHGVHLDVIPLREYDITPCGPCGDCNIRPVPCGMPDDTASLVDRLIRADGVLYAAPVHGFGLSSVMQTFIERAGVGHLRFERPLANKVAGVVVTGRRYSHDRVYGQLVDNVLLNRMIMAGSGFPAFVHDQFAPEEDREGLAAARGLIDRMIDMLRVLLLPHGGREDTARLLASLPRNERAALLTPAAA
ncbi:flavodoxin family protein [Streptomyces sp. ISL-98]|uniref:flavodoxin family protein n=1 Tax=Streptomyces sp. ISL-98 TaxID=2819192 RepID=UPI001BE85F08|nr:flavodoxin family protein [Streptomyces sp. ISL-98]MBT2510074.1 flavodoxin family protein [Streptomyces sp. ISL-98]